MTDDERWLELHRQIEAQIARASHLTQSANWQSTEGMAYREQLDTWLSAKNTLETWMPARLMQRIHDAYRKGQPHPGSILACGA